VRKLRPVLTGTLVAGSGTLAAVAAAAVLWSGAANDAAISQGSALLAGILLAVAAACLVLGIFLAWKAQRELVASIEAVRRQAEASVRRIGRPAVPSRNGDWESGLPGLYDLFRELETGIEDLIEQRQQREREVLRADQLAMVGQIAAGFAHEIRNPLTAIKMLIQAGRREADEPRLPAEDLDVIDHEILRMERSLQRFLDFARPPSPERRPLRLAAVVERVLALVQSRAAKQKVEIRFTPPESPIVVEADEDQMQQLVMNLVLNALDVMPSEGVLDIRIDSPEENQLELRVTDSGPGIPEELLPRLFDPFISTKEMGIGLGLAVSFRIAESHGGVLAAENRREGGAAFILRLPCAVPAVTAS